MKNILCVVLLIFSGYASSQITVTGGLSAQQLAEILSGSNINISNAVITGPASGYGSFVSGGTFAFPSGVILSNGLITNASGPNNDPNTSDNLGGAGTQQMTDLGGAASSDVVTLEFDFVVQSASVSFQYIFASEEYPEFAPPNQPSFNDVFAFYISGPGITGEENIALIPGTPNPVSIDNVNAVTNAQYYIDNINGSEIQFDGYTTDLTAVRTGLTPCQTYHLKLVIADIQTANRNSAVFLKENSFVQENVLGAETQTINADGVALEGCVRGSFAFQYGETSTQDRTINFTIGGSAVNGVDYAFLDNYITIPAGETSGTVYIDAFSDGLTEGPETIELIYTSGVCGGLDTVLLTINDSQPINFTLSETNLSCFGDNSGEILVDATGGFPPYTYYVTYPDGNLVTTTSNPITGLPAGQYSVQVHDTYGCKAEALVVGGQFNAGVTFLPDGSGVTYEAPLEITGFNPGQTIASVDQIQQICLTMEHSYLGDLWIRVESPSGATVVLKQQNGGGSCDLGEPIATGPVDGQGSSDTTPGVGYEYCFNANPTYGTMVNESNSFTRNYTDAVGNSYTDTYLPAGSYTSSGNFSALVGSPMNGTWKVLVTDQFGQDNGYIFNWYISLIGDLPDTTVVLTQPNEMTVTGLATNATCGSSNGSVNVSVLNGIAPVTFSWSNGATTEDLTNVGAGQYILTATDANGCSASATFLVNNTGSLALTETVTNATCFGGANGAISVVPSGGTQPYSLSWSNGQTGADISGLAAGNYTVTLSDGNGCQYSEIITVGQNAAIVPILVSSSDELCNTNNGSIDISVSGGNGSYAYSWSNGSSAQDLSDLNGGSYSVLVTDGLGCTGSGTFSIVNNLTGCSNYCYLSASSDLITSSQCGAANGTINISVLNAALPYSLTWSNGSTTEDQSGLLPGAYTVSITDVNNCSYSATYTVDNNSGNLSFGQTGIQNESCGNSNGSLNISVSGGTGPYSYAWSNGASSEDLSGLSAGSYTVSVTDALGCQISSTYSIQNGSGALNVSGQSSSAICSSANGSIVQTVVNSNGPVVFAWNNGATTQNVSGLLPGTYSCTISDASGCQIINAYTVGQLNGDISVSGVLVTNESCGNANGAINITATGNNLSYLWSNGQTSEDLTGISAGNYSCTISNAQGCSVSTGTIAVINNSGGMVVSNQAIVPATCSQSNGSINVSVFGGQSPYNYSWSNGASTEDISGLNAGIYTLQVSDANGCSLAYSVAIQNTPGSLSITNAVLAQPTCSPLNPVGSIDISVSGETAPYSYVWSNGQTTQDVTTLTPGTYQVIVGSSNGCSTSATYTIQSNGTTLSITGIAVNNDICQSSSGGINLSLDSDAGPYAYSWSNGEQSEDLTNVSAGVYQVTVTNTFGCSLTESVQVLNDAGSLSVSASILDETCGASNGSIDLTVSGGTQPVSYGWNNGNTSQDLTNISAGQYSVSVVDLYGCRVDWAGAVVNLTNGLTLDVVSVTSDNCSNQLGAIDIAVTSGGPVVFSWSNGSTNEDLNGIAGGNYTVTVTDDQGCSLTQTINVPNQTGTLGISFTNISNETCSNGQGFIDIEVSGAGPFTYFWSDGTTAQDLINVGAGIYSVQIADASGCVLLQSFTVGNDNISQSTVASLVTDAFCTSSNGAVDITVSAGISPFTFGWSNGQTTEDLTDIPSGNYSVTVTDGVGCQSTENVFVGSQNSGLGFTGLNINNAFCGQNNGDVTFFTGGTADNYYLDGVDLGTWQANNLSAGTYTVAISDNFGCYADSIITIGNNAFFNLNATVTDAACAQNNGAVNLSVTGGGGGATYTYLWSNGATTQDLSNVPSGTYTVTVTGTGGGGGGGGGQPCVDELTVTVGDNVDFVVSGTTSSDYCGQGTGGIDQTIESGSGLIFLWSNGATTEDISGLVFGTYTCSVSFPGGCTQEYSYTVSNQSNGGLISGNVSDENCLNSAGAVDVTVTGGSGTYSYAWSDGSTSEDINGLNQGTYTVTVTDDTDGCVFAQEFTVNNLNTLTSANGVVTYATCSTCLNGAINVTISGTSSSYTYNWSNGATTQDISGLNPGSYSVTITSAEGCEIILNFTILNSATIDEVAANSLEMSVHPNPATDEFTVHLTLPDGLVTNLELTDAVGKIILSQTVSESTEVLVHSKGLAEGIYLLRCTDGKVVKMERIVISQGK